jgi:glucans biosynthesis protein C
MNRIISRTQAFLVASPFNSMFKFPQVNTLKKNESIETLRGLAIILVVFGHIIGFDKTGGMRVADDSIFRYLYFTLEYIRMPLFTVISGWVYANKPIMNADRLKFIKGKLRRLIVPMLVISTLLFLFRMVIPGTNTKPELSALPNNLIFPYDLYWYLYSLFVIFIVISILDTQPFFRKLEGWFTTLACAFVALAISKTFLEEVPNFFSFKGATYLFPFFVLGIGLYRFRDTLLNSKSAFLLLCVFAISFVIQQMTWFGYLPMQEKHSVLGITVGLSAVMLLFYLKIKNNLLVWIGSYAYSIFLFHVFFTGGTRIVMLKAGIENKWVILFAGLILSIMIPFLRFWLLGLDKEKKKPAKVEATTEAVQ